PRGRRAGRRGERSVDREIGAIPWSGGETASRSPRGGAAPARRRRSRRGRLRAGLYAVRRGQAVELPPGRCPGGPQSRLHLAGDLPRARLSLCRGLTGWKASPRSYLGATHQIRPSISAASLLVLRITSSAWSQGTSLSSAV